MSRMKFMNTEIDNLTMDEAVEETDRIIQENGNAFVVTPNVDCLVKLENNQELAAAYAHARLILADGKPLIWISRWYKRPIKEKISGSDLFPRICELAAKKDYPMFFLGAAEGVAAKAAENLKKRFEGLKVAGVYSPPLGFEKNEEELDKIKKLVREARPAILILGLGCPKQELFIDRYRDELQVPVTFTLGASLDFEAGKVKRAPKWMSEHGFEWLFRITQDPKRLLKRYLVDDMKIFGMAIRYRNRK